MSIFNASRLLGRPHHGRQFRDWRGTSSGALRASTINSSTKTPDITHAAHIAPCLVRHIVRKGTDQPLSASRRPFTGYPFNTVRLQLNSHNAPRRSARDSRRGREGRAPGVWSATGWHNRDCIARCVGRVSGSCAVVQGTASPPRCRHSRSVFHSILRP